LPQTESDHGHWLPKKSTTFFVPAVTGGTGYFNTENNNDFTATELEPTGTDVGTPTETNTVTAEEAPQHLLFE